MAARVVYLVLTGAVRPDQVLGLTFTTKAASELRGRIRQALTDAGVLEDSDPDAEDVLEPTVATYNAYAAGLLTDHGLRIGHEPDTRVITDAARYQLGARVVDRHTGEVALLSDHPKTVIQNLLDLDGVDERAPRRARRRTPGRHRGAARLPGRSGRGASRQEPVHLSRGHRQGRQRHRAARRAPRPGRRRTAG